MNTDEANRQQTWTNNTQFITPNMLQLRLDTRDIIDRLQQYLSGEVMLPNTQPDGSTKFVTQQIGKKICNQQGVQQITNYVQSIVNPSVVQGNYEENHYYEHLDRIHRTLARQILANYHGWQMSYDDLEMVIDFIMNMIEPYMSRLIGNKERESYSQSMKVNESNTIQSGKSLLPIFGGGT